LESLSPLSQPASVEFWEKPATLQLVNNELEARGHMTTSEKN